MMFARSLRSLEGLTIRSIMPWLLIVAALLVGWMAWFFLADVTLYETSAAARLNEPQRLVADFPQTALARLRPGQPAQVRLDAFPANRYGTLPATVALIDEQVRNGLVQVTFTVQPETTNRLRLLPGMTGIVEVEVGRATPAVLALGE